MKDEKILHKIRRRDPEGLRALMNRYVPYVSTVVWNILRYADAGVHGKIPAPSRQDETERVLIEEGYSWNAKSLI